MYILDIINVVMSKYKAFIYYVSERLIKKPHKCYFPAESLRVSQKITRTATMSKLVK